MSRQFVVGSPWFRFTAASNTRLIMHTALSLSAPLCSSNPLFPSPPVSPLSLSPRSHSFLPLSPFPFLSSYSSRAPAPLSPHLTLVLSPINPAKSPSPLVFLLFFNCPPVFHLFLYCPPVFHLFLYCAPAFLLSIPCPPFFFLFLQCPAVVLLLIYSPPGFFLFTHSSPSILLLSPCLPSINPFFSLLLILNSEITRQEFTHNKQTFVETERYSFVLL